MTDFGTSEESAEVTPEQLEPGVRISPQHFGDGSTAYIVDHTRREPETGLVLVVAANFTTGETVEHWFRPDRKLTVWGRI